jgi:hypothetical protein
MMSYNHHQFDRLAPCTLCPYFVAVAPITACAHLLLRAASEDWYNRILACGKRPVERYSRVPGMQKEETIQSLADTSICKDAGAK